MTDLIRRFFPKPDNIAKRDYTIYFVITFICLLAIVTTVTMLTVAIFIKNHPLILINFFGFIAAIYVWHLARTGKLFFSVVSLCICLYFYCINATILLGWHAGFQYYLISLTAILILHPYFKTRIIALISVVPLLTYIWLYLILHDTADINPALSGFLHTCNILNTFVVLGFINYYFRTSILGLVKKLDNNAKTDLLTGLSNRGFMTTELTRYCNIAERYETMSSVLLLDIDNFKDINDAYGHIAGDKILKQFADLLLASLRQTDFVSRWGSDEFLILTPFASLKDAKKIAELIRATIQRHEFIYENHLIKLTVSIGAIELIPLRSIEDSLKKVDQLLLSAKQLGKNTVVVEPMLN